MSEKEEQTIKTQEECEAAGGTWTDGACKLPDKEAQAKKTADLPVNEKLIGVMKEYMDEVMKQFKADIETRLTEEKKAIEDELVSSVKTGLGLNKDPVVHLSQVEGLVRKMLLDKTDHGKKTLTETPDAPDGGDVTKTTDIEADFNKLQKQRGAL